SPGAQPSETPSAPSSVASPLPTENPSPTKAIATPSETTAQPSPTTAKEIAENNLRPARSPGPARKPTPSVVNTPGNPDDEKEEVELTLTKQLPERIELPKAFTAAQAQSCPPAPAYDLS